VASAGEALVDLILVEDDGGSAFRIHPGGSPFNVAIGLARLGLHSCYAGRISTDMLGRRLDATLEREGVDPSLVQHGPEPTPLAIVGGGRDVTYDFRWHGTADRRYDPAAIGWEPFESLDALHVGSAALGIDPLGSRLLELMERLRGRVFLTFDPNVRRDVVDDWPTYVHRVRRAALLADVVKASDEDLAALDEPSGRDAPTESTELPFGRSGPTIVTAGARGAILIRGGEPTVAVATTPVAVVDTVGAGDSAMAALIYGFAEHGLLRAGPRADAGDEVWTGILTTMTTAAAMTCERPGADPPRVADLRARLRG
jgi:fructokinase